MHSSCSFCTLCSAEAPVFGRGVKNPRYVFLGENPGRDEHRTGVSHSGQFGTLIASLFAESGIDGGSVWFDNLVKGPTTESGFSKSESTICSHYILDKLLEFVKSDTKPVIIALGGTVMEFLTGVKGITKNAGRSIDFSPPFMEIPDKKQPLHPVTKEPYKIRYAPLMEAGLVVVGSINPGALLRGREHLKSKIIADLTYARRVAFNEIKEYWKGYEYVTSTKYFTDWVTATIDRYNRGDIPFVAFDYETTGLRIFSPEEKTVCFSVSCDSGHALVVPYHHQYSKIPTSEHKEITKQVKRLVDAVPIVGWNFSFDATWMMTKFGFRPKNIFFDGLLANWWLYCDTGASNVLDVVVSAECGFFGHGAGLDKGKLIAAPVEDLVRYAGGDADGTYRLCLDRMEKLKKTKMYDDFMYMMMKGMPHVLDMTYNGISVSPELNAYLLASYPDDMDPILERIKNTEPGKLAIESLKKAGLNFNLASPHTLRELIFGQCHFPSSKQGKTGPSADKEVLKELVEMQTHPHHEVVKDVSEWRYLKDSYTRYVKPVPELVDPDWYIHPDFKMNGTVTGRFSSWFHGFPKKSKVRLQFVSRWDRQGGVILGYDMKQAEMRVLASLSGDNNLIDTITSGIDLHTANASKMFNVDIADVAPYQRDVAKRAGFGVVYGIGAKTLASNLGVAVAEAQRHIDNWNRIYPQTQSWIKEVYDSAKKYGVIKTAFGRIRWIKDIKSSRWGDTPWVQAYNSHIQSLASDVTYLAFREISQYLIDNNMRSKVIAFIHDSVMVDVAPGELWTVANLMKEKMEDWTNSTHPWIQAPMETDAEIMAGMGFPCSFALNKKDMMMTARGPDLNIMRLKIELARLGTHFSVEMSKDGETGIIFSYSPAEGTADYKAGMTAQLF